MIECKLGNDWQYDTFVDNILAYKYINLSDIHCDSIITRSIIRRSPHGSQIFFQCVKISADDRGIHNASCEIRIS